jgi:hypothetical protein
VSTVIKPKPKAPITKILIIKPTIAVLRLVRYSKLK